MAATAGAIRAGRAFVELFADDSRLVRGLKAASAKLRAWGRSITSIGYRMMAAGAALSTPFVIATKAFMSAGDELDKMSGRVGVSVEFLSALSHAAQIGGSDLATMEKGIRRLQRSALDASRGLSTQVEAFDQLGVSVQTADGQLKHTDALFMETVDALSKVENETQKAALAQMIFGRAGTALLPMLKGGKEGLLGVMEEAHELGIVMTTEDATAAAALTDAWTRLKSGLKAATVQIGAALAPALESAANWMKQFVAPTIEWIRENRALVLTVAKVSVGVLALGGAFVAAGMSLTLAGIAAGGFATALGVVSSLLGVIVSPIGLAVAALAGIVHYSGAGGKALEWLGGKFAELRTFASKAWTGIADAIQAGELSLAVEVAWAAVKVAWIEAQNWLKGIWEEFLQWFRDSGLADVFIDAVAEIKIAWAELIDFLEGKGILPKATETEFAKAVDKRNKMIAELLPPGERRAFEAGIEKARPKTLEEQKQEIEAERRAAHDRIASGKADEDRRRRERDAQNDLNDAQERFNALLAEAAKRKRDAMAGGGPERAGKPPGLPEFEGAIREAGMTVGTFSKFALAGLGMGGGPAERTAKATEATAKDLNWLRKRAAVWAAADQPARFGK